MAATIVGNALLRRVTFDTRALLSAGTWLQLFQNTPDLTHDLAITQFQQANFPGYVPIDISAQWRLPLKAGNGIWVFAMPDQLFPVTADDPQFVYGWFMNRGGEIMAAKYFETPYPCLTGGDIEFSVQVEVRDINLS